MKGAGSIDQMSVKLASEANQECMFHSADANRGNTAEEIVNRFLERSRMLFGQEKPTSDVDAYDWN